MRIILSLKLRSESTLALWPLKLLSSVFNVLRKVSMYALSGEMCIDKTGNQWNYYSTDRRPGNELVLGGHSVLKFGEFCALSHEKGQFCQSWLYRIPLGSEIRHPRILWATHHMLFVLYRWVTWYIFLFLRPGSGQAVVPGSLGYLPRCSAHRATPAHPQVGG